jgi:PAS domain S-box-containing protein
VAREEGRYEEEGWRVRKDGSRFWASVVITRLKDEKGNLIGYAKVTRDLTEKRETLENLRQSEERFRLMVKSVKDYAIFMLDPNGNVASWNEGARRFKGYEAGEIIGKHFSTFYTQEDKARHHPEYELKVAREEGRYEEEGWRVRKDGSRFWASVVITRVNDERGNLLGYAKVTRDLSERKINEEKLREANTGLEQRVEERTKDLQKALRSRDEFLSIASHELKTPLTSMKLQLQIATKRIEKDAPDTKLRVDTLKALSIGIRQVNSLTSLVDDLLDISRIQTGVFQVQKQKFNLSNVVEEITSRYTDALHQAKSSLELNLDRSIEGYWDYRRIEQVIVNLVYNAVKYAPGTPITVRTYLKNPDIACLEVTDKGPGISPDKIEKIFDRFERGNSPDSISGLGLGLFIVKKIIEHHHGSIRVESAPGNGASFIVELPL